MAAINDADALLNLATRLPCNRNMGADELQWTIARLLAGLYLNSIGAGSVATHTLSSDRGAPADTPITVNLQSVTIQLLAPIYDGSNEMTASITPSGALLSNNPEVGRTTINMDASDFGGVNYRLPTMTFAIVTGTPEIQWIGISNNT